MERTKEQSTITSTKFKIHANEMNVCQGQEKNAIEKCESENGNTHNMKSSLFGIW